jgi:acyl-coenzyme A synthetase/AMP-(fatty) acid ligase
MDELSCTMIGSLSRGASWPTRWQAAALTSGLLPFSLSAGKPKGIQHSTGGYLLFALLTSKYVFNLHADDIHCCAADVGWVTGHSYIVYGPLALGATTFMFESTPLYPDHNRYWDMVERHKLTTLYTSPTALRALMRFPVEEAKKRDRSSLRILGTVGEVSGQERTQSGLEQHAAQLQSSKRALDG